MFENNMYSYSSGKQRVRIPQKRHGNIYAYSLGGTKRKRKVVKRGK